MPGHSRSIFAIAFSFAFSYAASASAEAEKPQPEPPKERIGIGALAGIGFPRPLSIEGIARFDRTLAIGAEYSMMPKLTISGVDTTLWALAASARVFPFKGPFFIGMRAGRQHLDASATITIPQLGALPESYAIDTWFINPRIGFLWTWNPIAFGVDAGVQIPLTSSTSSTLPP